MRQIHWSGAPIVSRNSLRVVNRCACVRIAVGGLLIGQLFLLPELVTGATATYYLHPEASTSLGRLQLRPESAESSPIVLQSGELKQQGREYVIQTFDTPAGVPNAAGTLLARSPVTMTLWMKKTTPAGTMLPRVKFFLSGTPGPALCLADGAAPLTTTMTKFTLQCTTDAPLAMATTDRFAVWIGVRLIEPPEVPVVARLAVGGTLSAVVLPLPVATTASAAANETSPRHIVPVAPTADPWTARITAAIYRQALGPADLIAPAVIMNLQGEGSSASALLSAAGTTTSYDVANRQLQFGDKQMTYDANGNRLSLTDLSGTTTFAWDARNRLIGLSGPGVTASFTYDAFGRRITKTVNGSTTEYLYDGLNVVQQIIDGVAVPYLYSLRVDEPLVRSRTEFYLADGLGSVVGLTDASGALTARYSYEPFGKTTLELGTTTNPFQYTARELDETGLYYYRSRYYHPDLHRFISEDPVAFRGGDTNLYAYVMNNPVAFSDPTGELLPQLLVGAGVGAFAGGLSAVMSNQNVLVGMGVGAATGAAVTLGGPTLSAVANVVGNIATQLASGTPPLDLNLTSIALSAGAGWTSRLTTGALTAAGISPTLAEATAGMALVPLETGLSHVIGLNLPFRLSNFPVPPRIPLNWLPYPPPYSNLSLDQHLGGFPQRLGGRK